MDYFQGVVSDYLRANRATFVNAECCIQLDAGGEPLKGRHWYCDAVAANFLDSTIYLCEITYSKQLKGLVDRLHAWSKCWPELCTSIARDCSVPSNWTVRPWVFIPSELRSKLDARLQSVGTLMGAAGQMPHPRVTNLEDVLPWKYSSWNRQHVGQEHDA